MSPRWQHRVKVLLFLLGAVALLLSLDTAIRFLNTLDRLNVVEAIATNGSALRRSLERWTSAPETSSWILAPERDTLHSSWLPSSEVRVR